MIRLIAEYSAQAEFDIIDSVDYYSSTAGARIAGQLSSAVEACVSRIEAWPEAGSQRYGEILGIPGLRHVNISRFPYAIFYLLDEQRVLIIRMLHTARDIPATLAEH